MHHLIRSLLVAAALPVAASAAEVPTMALESPSPVRLRFSGPLGDRVRLNVEQWLLTAPVANPGMLGMFRCRDREPVPQLVPWAGEFVGKYLISAIQALRMTDDARLRPFVAQVVAELISTQAEDGYLGPFRRQERLLGNWDLWGHYHVMLALLMWYEDTGDRAALDCARRAADLACRTFLDGTRRVHDAGSHEMNMAIVHGLGRLYRHTGEARYRQLMDQVVADWEKPPAGDYLRSGLAEVDFYRSPKPRWESLHDLQGLVEMYRITGEARYRQAFVQHWTSIRNYDRHPSGGFTTGEQAVGNPYSRGAIETCCTIAWMALTVDMLRLTGDPAAADELELATWNGMLGAQHPSGRWWTYNTPVDGMREASAHTIVFQSRAGTPELNCCSVNAPRGLGMLSEWAVMLDAAGPVVNYYGPCEARLNLPDGTPLVLRQETRYPVEGTVRLVLGLPKPTTVALRLRIPAWSQAPSLRVNGQPAADTPRPGTYLALRQEFGDGATLDLDLGLPLHAWAGELGRRGTAALFRGPILLTFDSALNAMDCPQVPTLDLRGLRAEPVPVPAPTRFVPLVAVRVTADDGQDITLCDFATAGANGTDYRAWLPVRNAPPAVFHLKRPAAGARLPTGPVEFAWTGYRPGAAAGRTFRLDVSSTADFARPTLVVPDLRGPQATVRDGFAAGSTLHWRVVAVNANGETANAEGPRSFTVDASLPAAPPVAAVPEAPEPGPDGVLVRAPLAGRPEPGFGLLEAATDLAPAAGRDGQTNGALAGNGTSSRLVYRLPFFPETDYSASVWVCPDAFPTDRIQEVVSAWAVSMDDPLRLVIQGRELFARIEAGNGYGTAGVPLEAGRWVHVAGVKEGAQLRLYVNGELKHTAPAPESVTSSALNVGVGGNPNYGGNERLLGRVAEFALHARALSAAEVAALAQAAPAPKP